MPRPRRVFFSLFFICPRWFSSRYSLISLCLLFLTRLLAYRLSGLSPFPPHSPPVALVFVRFWIFVIHPFVYKSVPPMSVASETGITGFNKGHCSILDRNRPVDNFYECRAYDISILDVRDFAIIHNIIWTVGSRLSECT